MARLVITSPDGKSGILELNKEVVSIGRGTANDLVLNDTSVSRLHAVIKKNNDGTFTIADRGSTNGIIIDGKRISGERMLKRNDVMKMGVYQIKYEEVNEASFVIKSADIPSTLHDVLKGKPAQDLSLKAPPSAPTPTGSITELSAVVKKLERENYLLKVLFDAGKALSSKLSVDDIAEQVMNLAFRIEGVERGFMQFFDRNGEIVRQTDVKYRRTPTSEQPQIILSRSIMERIKTESQPILITDVSIDERFRGSESMKISGLRSAMVAPLNGQKHLVGLLYVDNLEKTMAFTQEELNIFALVASQAAAAIDNALAHDELAEQAKQRSTLERFLAPDVVEMISSNPEGVQLGGTNMKCTVLFADIRGFTSLSEKLAPEKVVEILNEYLTRVTDIIFDHGGMLDKYLGDGFMAVFGAPIPKGNDAANAVKTGIAIQRMVAQLNRDAAARKWPELKVGVGINTGMVTAGNIGSPKRLDYTVIGDAVNTSSRLMSSASGGQIYISESTYEEIDKSQFNIGSLPPIIVKGKSEPLKVFIVRWVQQQPAAAAASSSSTGSDSGSVPEPAAPSQSGS